VADENSSKSYTECLMFVCAMWPAEQQSYLQWAGKQKIYPYDFWR